MKIGSIWTAIKVAVKIAGKVAEIKELPIIEQIIQIIDDAIAGRPVVINPGSTKLPTVEGFHFPKEFD